MNSKLTHKATLRGVSDETILLQPSVKITETPLHMYFRLELSFPDLSSEQNIGPPHSEQQYMVNRTNKNAT